MSGQWSQTGLQFMATPQSIVEAIATELQGQRVRIFQDSGFNDWIEKSGFDNIDVANSARKCELELYFASPGFQSASREELRELCSGASSFRYPGLCADGALPESAWSAGWNKSEHEIKSELMKVRRRINSLMSRGGRVRRVGYDWAEHKPLLYTKEALAMFQSGTSWRPICSNPLVEYSPPSDSA